MDLTQCPLRLLSINSGGCLRLVVGSKIETYYSTMSFDVRPTVLDDCEVIARDIRQADLKECVMNETTPLEALLDGYAHSFPCYTIVDLQTDTPVAMFGVVDPKVDMSQETLEMLGIDEDTGVCWMLGTDGLAKYPTQVVRHGPHWLDQIHHESKFKKLMNFVHEENILHLKWLEWCGFEVGPRAFDSGSQEYIKQVERTLHTN